MTNDPIAVLLKFAFLALLFLFILWVSRSALRDVVGRGAGVDDDTGPTAAKKPRERGARPRLEVVAAMGHAPGDMLLLDGEAMLGRSPTVDVHVEDPFASAAHARIYARNGQAYIEDMGSTNGTFLNGQQLHGPERLRPADSIRIGDTEYRYQE
jgi:FHA domain